MRDGPTGPPPGWYPDPEGSGAERWWDGGSWGVTRQPPGGGSPGGWGTQPPGQDGWGTPPAGDWGPPGGPGGSRIDPWFWQSIAATVLCCLPAGVVAIVMSSQAKSALEVGNLELARQKADLARTWTIASVILGLIAGAIYVTVVGPDAGLL